MILQYDIAYTYTSIHVALYETKHTEGAKPAREAQNLLCECVNAQPAYMYVYVCINVKMSSSITSY